MARIKLTEAQVNMLQNLNLSKPKKLKITQEQYDRIFTLNENKKLTGHPIAGDGGDEYNPQTEKENETTTHTFNESISEDVSTIMSAGEFLLHFKDLVKEIMTNPSQRGLDPFWIKHGITWGDLITGMASVGLCSVIGIGAEQAVKLVPKKEFFLKLRNGGLKRLYNIFIEKRYDMKNGGKVMSQEEIALGDDMELTEVGGYPAGAEHDPNAPWNRPDGEPEQEPEEPHYKVPSQKPLKLVWYDEDEDGLAIFENKGKLYAHVGGVWFTQHDDLDQYCNSQDANGVNGECISNYVNDTLVNRIHKAGKYNENYQATNLITLIDDNVKADLLHYYGDADGLAELLNRVSESVAEGDIEETTTTGSVGGAYVTPKIWAKSPSDMRFAKKPMYKQGKIVEDTPESTMAAPQEKKVRGPKPASDMDRKIDAIVKTLYKTYPELKNHRINLRFTIGDALSKLALGVNESVDRKGQVEFDDCTELNNNKEAQNGGCSVGAVDNVVKIKEDLYVEVATRTGKTISEVKKIIESNFNKK